MVFLSDSDISDAVKQANSPKWSCRNLSSTSRAVRVSSAPPQSLIAKDDAKRLRHCCTHQCFWNCSCWGLKCRKAQSPLCQRPTHQERKLRHSGPDTQSWGHHLHQRPLLFQHQSLPERRQLLHRLTSLESSPSNQMSLLTRKCRHPPPLGPGGHAGTRRLRPDMEAQFATPLRRWKKMSPLHQYPPQILPPDQFPRSSDSFGATSKVCHSKVRRQKSSIRRASCSKNKSISASHQNFPAFKLQTQTFQYLKTFLEYFI